MPNIKKKHIIHFSNFHCISELSFLDSFLPLYSSGVSQYAYLGYFLNDIILLLHDVLFLYNILYISSGKYFPLSVPFPLDKPIALATNSSQHVPEKMLS